MKKGINIISLFDGMSGGRIALDRAGIKVDNYYSSEIDKFAISIADKNWPQDTKNRLGSVTDITEEQLLALPQIDMIIGGSPCQGFSLAGKMRGSRTVDGIDVTTLEQYLELKSEGFEFDGQSFLFWEYVRIWKILKPKYFFLENVRIVKKWLPIFNDTMGVNELAINSQLLSAQYRQRYYWTNIPGFTMPLDLGLSMDSVLEDDITWTEYMTVKGKSFCLTTKCGGGRDWNSVERSQNTMGLLKSNNHTSIENEKTIRQKKDQKIGYVEWDFKRVNDKYYRYEHPEYRRLNCVECERLQTVPDNYTSGVSNSQRYKMIGNGWTISIISHFFQNLSNDFESYDPKDSILVKTEALEPKKFAITKKKKTTQIKSELDLKKKIKLMRLTEQQALVLFDIAKTAMNTDGGFAGYSNKDLMTLLNEIISQQDNKKLINLVDVKDVKDVKVEEVAKQKPKAKKKTVDVVVETPKTEDIKVEEVKTEEVKTEEVKTEEVKTEDIKVEEVKTEETTNKEVEVEEVKTEETTNEEVEDSGFW